MVVDEFYFHLRRGLPRWERVGHPIDTLFFLIPIGMLSFLNATAIHQSFYLFFSIVSCMVITKDEWVHREEASGSEQWLHAMLFMLHPVVLFSGFMIWLENGMNFSWLFYGVLTFCLYQVVFWNFYANRVFKKRF